MATVLCAVLGPRRKRLQLSVARPPRSRAGAGQPARSPARPADGCPGATAAAPDEHRRTALRGTRVPAARRIDRAPGQHAGRGPRTPSHRGHRRSRRVGCAHVMNKLVGHESPEDDIALLTLRRDLAVCVAPICLTKAGPGRGRLARGGGVGGRWCRSPCLRRWPRWSACASGAARGRGGLRDCCREAPRCRRR